MTKMKERKTTRLRIQLSLRHWSTIDGVLMVLRLQRIYAFEWHLMHSNIEDVYDLDLEV